MALKVGIYCRLSEEDKNKQSGTDDSGSIQNQKSMLIRYALEQGWEIYQIYSDDDYAGADRNRPGFKKLLSDAQQRKLTGYWRTQKIVNLILSCVRHNPDLPEN